MEGALLHASTCRAAALSILTPHTLTLDQALPAVRAGNVAVADGNRYFNRSSCGVLETAEMVAESVLQQQEEGHRGRTFTFSSNIHPLERLRAAAA